MSKFYDENIGEVIEGIEKTDAFIKGLYAERYLFKKLLLLSLIKNEDLELYFDDSDLASVEGFDLEYEVTKGGRLRVNLIFPEKGIVQ